MPPTCHPAQIVLAFLSLLTQAADSFYLGRGLITLLPRLQMLAQFICFHSSLLRQDREIGGNTVLFIFSTVLLNPINTMPVTGHEMLGECGE